MNQNKTFAAIGCYILIAAAGWGALAYVIYHFIRKFW